MTQFQTSASARKFKFELFGGNFRCLVKKNDFSEYDRGRLENILYDIFSDRF